MQAIQTKYFGPTNNRGSRIKATCAAGSLTIPYPYALSGQAAHRAAADALIAKLGWDKGYHGDILGGQLADGTYAFVFNHVMSRD